MPLPEPPVMLEFRDGEQAVAAYIASNIAMAGIDPVRYTKEEAIHLADKALERSFIDGFAAKLIHKHFRDNR